MSKKANPALIGAFVSGAVVLAVIAIMIFGSGRIFRDTERFILYFQDSINGLEVGAPVKFKGVRIGQVTNIYIRFNQDDTSPHVPVVIEIDTGRLSNTLGVEVDLGAPDVFKEQVEILGLRAQLQQASFVTGMLFVELDYYPDSATPFYIQQADHETGEKRFLEIPTVSTGFTEVIKKVSKMVDQISKIDFARIGDLTTDILVKVDDGLGSFDFPEINDKTVAVLTELNAFLNDPETKALSANLNLTLADGRTLINNLDAQLDPIMGKLSETTDAANKTLEEFQTVARSVNIMLEPDSPLRYEIDNALREFAGASRSIRILADYLERNPSALLTGKGDQR